MSFIAGLLFTANTPAGIPDRKAATQAALRLLSVPGRGQDDTGAWAATDTGEAVAMAVRMHRTRDLSHDGAQPWPHQGVQNPRYVVAFDGYIGNARDLRRELEEKGTRLRGHGDAELVAEGAAHWGLNRLLQKMEGAFAFALWDTHEKALHLVRDRMGARPLYTAQAGDVTAFASDLRAFRHVPGFEPVINPEAARAYLNWGYVPAPATLWQGAASVPPAHRLMIRAGDTLPAPEAYWSPAATLEESVLRGDAHQANTGHRLDRLSATLCAQATDLDVAFAQVGDNAASASALRGTLARVSDKPFRTVFIDAPDGAALQTAFDTLAALGEPVSDPAAPALWNTLRHLENDTPVAIGACAVHRPAPDTARDARLRRTLRYVPRFARALLPAHLAALAHDARDAYAASAAHWPGLAPLPEPIEPRIDASADGRMLFHAFTLGFCEGAMPGLDRVAAAANTELRVALAGPRLLDIGFPALPAPAYADAAIWLRGPLRPRVQDLMQGQHFARLGIADAKPYLDAWRAFLGGDDTQIRPLWTLVTLLAWTKASQAA